MEIGDFNHFTFHWYSNFVLQKCFLRRRKKKKKKKSEIFSESTGRIEVKFHVAVPWDGETKNYINN